MKLSQVIKPITYLQDHASDLIQQFAEGEQTFVITENGEARAVFLDIRLYEQMQESLALLKILALSTQHLRNGQVKPVEQAFQNVRQKIKEARPA